MKNVCHRRHKSYRGQTPVRFSSAGLSSEALAKEELFTCPPSLKATAGKPAVCG